MDILFLLVPLSVMLALGVMGVLAWAVWSGQFDELDTEGQRILMPSPNEALNATDPNLIQINMADVHTVHTLVSTQRKRVQP